MSNLQCCDTVSGPTNGADVSQKDGYTIRVCQNAGCSLRFPVLDSESRGNRCPRCGSETVAEVRAPLEPETPLPWSAPLPCSLHLLLDNIRSTFNVGSILRVADGAGVTHVHLSGITPTPSNAKVTKTSLGAESSVAWSYYDSSLDAAAKLLGEGIEIWALENHDAGTNMLDCALPTSRAGVALVAGNEISGVDPELLSLCERVLYIPMAGAKGSLNVAVAVGIAVYWLRGTKVTS